MSAVLSHILRDPARCNRSKKVDFSGEFLTTTSGTLSTTVKESPHFTLTKVAATAGRYTVTLVDGAGNAVTAVKLCGAPTVTVKTASASAAYTAAKATVCIMRTDSLATAGTFLIQMIRADTFADAEVEDGATLLVSFSVKLTAVL